jgi:hypothetical protein
MQSVIYAATRYGYCVKVLDGGQVIHECSAGNCWKESPTVIDPTSPHAIRPYRLRAWAKSTAGQIAKERGIPPKQIEYDADLENHVIGV